MRFSILFILIGLVTACGQDVRWPWQPASPKTQSTAISPAASEPVAADRAIPVSSPEDLPEGNSQLTNLSTLIGQLGLAPYHQLGFHGQGLRIAVLDNGFAGLSLSRGQRLPPDIQVQPSPLAQMEDTTHGVKLAEIIYALSTGQALYSPAVPGPEILLYNADGFTNFQASVAAAVQAKVDMIVYAQVWEYGGNFDGKGFINKVVDTATNAGILWVNAAGNLGLATYNGAIKIGTDGRTVALPYEGRYVRFTVPQDNTPCKIVLAWNDFDDSKDYRTSEDLDLVLEDASGHEIAASRLKQLGNQVAVNDENTSAHAREIIDTQLGVGTYYLRVEARTQNFDQASRLRLTVDGAGVQLLERSTDQTVLIPADNPAVLTVGAADVNYSGQMRGQGVLTKPEVQVASEVDFSDGTVHQGTSSASAIVAGALAVYQSAYGRIGRAAIGPLLNQGTLAAPGSTAPALLRLVAPSSPSPRTAP